MFFFQLVDFTSVDTDDDTSKDSSNEEGKETDLFWKAIYQKRFILVISAYITVIF